MFIIILFIAVCIILKYFCVKDLYIDDFYSINDKITKFPSNKIGTVFSNNSRKL